MVSEEEKNLRARIQRHEHEIESLSEAYERVWAERDEAREVACQLLTIAEARGPKVWGNGGRFPWLKPKK